MSTTKEKLKKLLNSMARREGIPSTFIDDHDCFFPKNMSQKQRDYLMKQIKDADDKIGQWTTDLCSIIHDIE
jgi:hypothetical protein